MISTQQKAILRRIAKEQLESFIRIVETGKYQEVIKEMEEEGFEVSELETLAYFSGQLELWERIADEPEHFTNLDDLNLGMLKHILFNEFALTSDTRGIWKKINIVDKANKFLN